MYSTRYFCDSESTYRSAGPSYCSQEANRRMGQEAKRRGEEKREEERGRKRKEEEEERRERLRG